MRRRALPHAVAARAAARRPPRRPLGGRRRPRARDAPRCVPARPVPDARRDTARLVLTGAARRRSRSSLHALALAAPCRAALRDPRRHAFATVVDGCARPGDRTSWIDDRDHRRVHAAARARLGTLGRGVGRRGARGRACTASRSAGLFAAESMFHARTDASKAAFVGLVELLRAAGDADRRLLDVQWLTPHLESLGAVELAGPSSASPCRRTRAHRSLALMDPSAVRPEAGFAAGRRARGLAAAEEGSWWGNHGSPTSRRAGRCRSRGRSRRAAGRARSRPPRRARRPPGEPPGRGRPPRRRTRCGPRRAGAAAGG